jgi:RNA polymerase sigma-70 factor (ECF subfamily)
MDDLDIIEDFKKGNALAFEALLLKYQDRIYNLCRYLLENPHDADDAAQDSFVKAFQGLKRFTPTASFYTWLYRIAVNTCLDQRRKASSRTLVCRRRHRLSGYGPLAEPLSRIRL